MFEHIHFFSMSGNYKSEEVLKSAEYHKTIKDVEVASPDHLSYVLEGQSKYLLSHPMSKEARKHLIYIQSFNYMISGEKYYTKRDDFSSYLVLFTYDGCGTLTYNGTTYELTKGDGFFIDCRKEHIYKTKGSSWEHSDLHLYGGNISYLYQQYFSDQSPIFHFASLAHYQNLLEEIVLTHSTSSSSRDFFVSTKVNQLIALLYENKTQKNTAEVPTYIRYLQQYIEHHMTEDLSIDELSSFSNISKYHMIRQFKEYTGFTPHEYIIHLRLLQAESLLQMTDMPGYQIGLAVGFSTEASFIKHFKKFFGVTPGYYRKGIS